MGIDNEKVKVAIFEIEHPRKICCANLNLSLKEFLNS